MPPASLETVQQKATRCRVNSKQDINLPSSPFHLLLKVFLSVFDIHINLTFSVFDFMFHLWSVFTCYLLFFNSFTTDCLLLASNCHKVRCRRQAAHKSFTPSYMPAQPVLNQLTTWKKLMQANQVGYEKRQNILLLQQSATLC